MKDKFHKLVSKSKIITPTMNSSMQVYWNQGNFSNLKLIFSAETLQMTLCLYSNNVVNLAKPCNKEKHRSQSQLWRFIHKDNNSLHPFHTTSCQSTSNAAIQYYIELFL